MRIVIKISTSSKKSLNGIYNSQIDNSLKNEMYSQNKIYIYIRC